MVVSRVFVNRIGWLLVLLPKCLVTYPNVNSEAISTETAVLHVNVFPIRISSTFLFNLEIGI